MMERRALAAQLKEAARLLEVLGSDAFRARAYASAARNLEAFDGDFETLWREGRLTEIRGIGKGLAAELDALDGAGELPLLAELRARVPPEVRELFAVSGLGAKKVATLWEAGIVGLGGLLAALEEGRVAELKGFGKKSAASLLEAARFAHAARERLRIDGGDLLAAALLEHLHDRLPDARLAVAGELRRRCETVGGLELVLTGADPAALEDALAQAGDAPAERSGEAWRVRIGGRPVRLTLCAEEQFGAVLAVRTGSAEFVRGLREAAEGAGLELSGRGLVAGEAPVAVPDEEALFERLGLEPVPPELREEAGAGPVPGLLRLEEIRGVVHNHTTWSDAAHTVREMAVAARAAGFAYLALADHSRSSYWANGLSVERVRAQAEEVREARAELGGGFELLHGIEVDVHADGALDYPDELLAELDWVVVSVHQHFGLSREAQTERLVRAVRNPYADVLGHATGRLLLRRPSYDVDLDAVIDACAETGTVIEINANPARLDLDWRWVRVARERGCRFSIDPDAHHVDGYDDLRYGVAMARKAGLTAEDVVNTAPTGRDFLARLKRSSPPS